MINYLDIAKETDSELIPLDNKQIMLEVESENNAIEYIDKISLMLRNYTNWFYSSN